MQLESWKPVPLILIAAVLAARPTPSSKPPHAIPVPPEPDLTPPRTPPRRPPPPLPGDTLPRRPGSHRRRPG